MKKKIEMLESENFKDELNREMLLAIFMTSAIAGLARTNEVDSDVIASRAESIAAACYDRYCKLTQGEGEREENNGYGKIP